MSASQEDPPVFDYDYFNRYTSEDEALQREVLALFFGQIESMVEGLDPHSGAEDWKAAAHAIKGSARGLGMGKLGRHCEHLEDIMSDASAAKAAEKAILVTEVEAVHVEVAGRYPGLLPL